MAETRIQAGENQSTTYRDMNTSDALATDRVAIREPTLTEKALAVVDEKKEEVMGRINEATQGLQQGLNEATQGLQKELNPDSHELARQNPTIHGAVTQHGVTGIDGRVTDIGWHKDPALIPDPLIDGISNGAVFSFIRRFNKVRNRWYIQYVFANWLCRMFLTFGRFPWRSQAASTSTNHGLQIMRQRRSLFSSSGFILPLASALQACYDRLRDSDPGARPTGLPHSVP